MSIRRKLILMFAGWLVLTLAFFSTSVTALNRIEKVRLALRTTEQVRLEILLQSRALAEFVTARQNDDRMRASEAAQHLRDHMARITASLTDLTDGEDGATLSHLAPEQVVRSLREAEDAWMLVRDALESVLAGR